MKIIRSTHATAYFSPWVTDQHIIEAIADPSRINAIEQLCKEGMIYRIFGYTRPLKGQANVVFRNEHGQYEMALLEVVYLDWEDITLVMYAAEADEEGFAAYG